MDFSKVDIYPVLKSSVPKRFSDMSPFDFEDFIAELFKEKGFQVKQTSKSGDFGADLIVKDEISSVVQVKRYAKGNKVGVQDVNQVLGAKDYYDCEKAIVITTSSFSSSALKLCEKTKVEIWDWDKLLKEINDLYFKGQNYYDFFKEELSEEKQENLKLDFELSDIKYYQKMEKNGEYTLIFMEVTNKSNQNLNLIIGSPIYISKNNYQAEMDYWYTGYFTSGVIYAGATVEIAFMYKSAKVSQVKKGDKLIIEIGDKNGNLIYTEHYDIQYKNSLNFSLNSDDWQSSSLDNSSNSQSNCFVVTMCYGRNTIQYKEMIFFRDNFLRNYKLGIKFISCYYKYGKKFTKKFKNNTLVTAISKIIIYPIVKIVTFMNNIIK